MEEVFLLYFAHFFDCQNPELIGVFDTFESAELCRKTLVLPSSWKGRVILTAVRKNECFVQNGFFIHPLAKENKKMEEKR